MAFGFYVDDARRRRSKWNKKTLAPYFDHFDSLERGRLGRRRRRRRLKKMNRSSEWCSLNRLENSTEYNDSLVSTDPVALSLSLSLSLKYGTQTLSHHNTPYRRAQGRHMRHKRTPECDEQQPATLDASAPSLTFKSIVLWLKPRYLSRSLPHPIEQTRLLTHSAHIYFSCVSRWDL